MVISLFFNLSLTTTTGEIPYRWWYISLWVVKCLCVETITTLSRQVFYEQFLKGESNKLFLYMNEKIKHENVIWCPNCQQQLLTAEPHSESVKKSTMPKAEMMRISPANSQCSASSKTFWNYSLLKASQTFLFSKCWKRQKPCVGKP